MRAEEQAIRREARDWAAEGLSAAESERDYFTEQINNLQAKADFYELMFNIFDEGNDEHV